MNTPSVSIIVPGYKTEQYLDQCVQSLLEQTLENIEIILVDDSSPDHALSMCDMYYPSLVQFHLTGIILFLLFWTSIVCLSLWRYKRQGPLQLFATVQVTACIQFIGNISDSLLTSHKERLQQCLSTS